MSHSSNEWTHTLCSHDVSDCSVKKGKKHPLATIVLALFFCLALVSMGGGGISQFKVHLLSSYVSFLLLKGLALRVHIHFSSRNIKRAIAWISMPVILLRTRNGHLLSPAKYFLLSWLFKCQLYGPQALQLHFHRLLSAYCNISQHMFSISRKRLWYHRKRNFAGVLHNQYT